MTKRTANQEKALKHWQDNHPGYVPQLSAYPYITFKHKETGDKVEEHIDFYELRYNESKREDTKTKKRMKKGLTNEPKPDAVRQPRRGPQNSFAGKSW